MSEDHSNTTYRSDRLLYSRFIDEPFDDKHLDYQKILDSAYKFMDEGNLIEACALLEIESDFDKSLYQLVRTEYIIGSYYEELDANHIPTDQHGRDDPIGTAAEHYGQGAQYAHQIPDQALVAQLRKFESDMCYGSNPHCKRYIRASAAARDALENWHKWRDLSGRDSTTDLDFEFILADDLGVRALMVAEDDYAVHGLERAAILLMMLQNRDDFPSSKYANYDFFLDWNWAALHHSMGNFELAFNRALQARDKAINSSTLRNFGRVNSLIAEIALDAVDGEIVWKGYKRKRQLIVADKAILKATQAAEECHDKAGELLALLVSVRWNHLFQKEDNRQLRDDRLAMFEEIKARATAIENTDPILFARVEIAWGDEYAYRNKATRSKMNAMEAKRYYEQAKNRLADVEAFVIVRVARKRLERLFHQTNLPPPKTSTKPSRTSKAPRRGTDISQN